MKVCQKVSSAAAAVLIGDTGSSVCGGQPVTTTCLKAHSTPSEAGAFPGRAPQVTVQERQPEHLALCAGCFPLRPRVAWAVEVLTWEIHLALARFAWPDLTSLLVASVVDHSMTVSLPFTCECPELHYASVRYRYS